MFFKVKNSVQEIKDWLAEFQHIVEKAAGKQHLHFAGGIWTNNKNLPPSEKKNKVQISSNDEFHFQDMIMSWSTKGYLQFVVFRKKVQKLN